MLEDKTVLLMIEKEVSSINLKLNTSMFKIDKITSTLDALKDKIERMENRK